MGYEFGALLLSLFFAGIALLLLVILWICWWAARWKGVAAWGLLVVSLCVWQATVVYSTRQRDEARRQDHERSLSVARMRCVRDAGEFTVASMPTPKDIYVRLDPRFASPPDGASAIVRQQLHAPTTTPDDIHYVASFPEPRPADAAFVDVSLIHEPVPGSDVWPVIGVSVVIMAADQTVIARRLDFKTLYDWCLGGPLNLAIERFVQQRLGKRIALADPNYDRRPLVPTGYPVGIASPMTPGRYAGGVNYALQPEVLERVLLKHHCVKAAENNKMECGGPPPTGSIVDLAGVMTFADDPRGLLLINRPAAERFIYWFDVDELSSIGVVRRTWRIRFAPIQVDQFENGGIISAQDLKLEPPRMRIDLLTQRISVPGQPTVLYGQKFTVRSDLDGVFEEGPTP